MFCMEGYLFLVVVFCVCLFAFLFGVGGCVTPDQKRGKTKGQTSNSTHFVFHLLGLVESYLRIFFRRLQRANLVIK